MEKNIAVLGNGYWGKNLVRNFQQIGALRTVCDPIPEALLSLKKTNPELIITSSVDEVFADPAIKGVVIATPAVTHFDLAKKAMLAGKDVFVEKPLALELNEGKELKKIAAQTGRILMVGHLLEYHPAVDKLKELIGSGSLGQLQYIYSNRLNWGKIRKEENTLWSFAPHDISVILSLVGDKPVQVSCHGGNYIHQHIADATISTLKFANGVQAHIFVSWLHPYKEQKLVVVGSQKLAVFDDVATDGKLKVYAHRIDWKNHAPVAIKGEPEIVAFDPTEPLKLECQHFIDRIQDRKPARTDSTNGLNVLEVLQTCQASLEKNGTNIDLTGESPIERDYFVHETSAVDAPTAIGKGTKIWHYSHVMKNSVIGEGCNIGQNVLVSSDVVVGNNVKIQNNVSLYTGVILEDDVFCGPSCVFTNVMNPRSAVSRKDEYRKTLVRQGATIGANSTIVCGNTIGAHAFIGAGSVVTRDVPDYALIYGNPARIAGWVCRCGVKLDFAKNPESAACEACGLQYSKKGETVTSHERKLKNASASA